MRRGKDKLRHGVYVAGMALESLNRVADILGKRQPVKQGVIYRIYQLGKYLK